MLTYDFQIQYKKGATLQGADFLSRDVVKCLKDVINSIDPFGPDLQELQKSDEQLIKINALQKENKWPLNATKFHARLFLGITRLLTRTKSTLLQKNKMHYTTIYVKTHCLQTNETQHCLGKESALGAIGGGESITQ
jgi:hypothetical protein